MDRILRLCVRNFSTLFLVVFVVIIPLHLIYAFVFHNVFAVQELHPAIADLPPRRMVRGVDQAAISRARLWFWVLVAVEVVAIPLFVRAAARILSMDAGGRVPSAVAAWRTLGDAAKHRDSAAPGAGAISACLLIGVMVGALTWLILASLVDLVPDPATAAGLALADATSRAAGAAFLLTPLALRSGGRTRAPELKI